MQTITLKKQISQGYCISIPSLAAHPDRKIELTTSKVVTEGGELEVQALRDLDTNGIYLFAFSSYILFTFLPALFLLSIFLSASLFCFVSVFF